MRKIIFVLCSLLFCVPLFAGIVVEPSSLNLYKVKKGDIVKRSFEVRNPSSSDLSVNRIYGDCSCVSVEPFNRIIPPYGAIEVNVVFDSNQESGTDFRKIVYISLQGEERTLDVYGQIVPNPAAGNKSPVKNSPSGVVKKNTPSVTAEFNPHDSRSPVYIAYFYTVKCGKCAKARKLLESAKRTVPYLSVREFDMSEKDNRVMLEAMSALYSVPAGVSIAPPVLFLAGPAGDVYVTDITAEKLDEAIRAQASARQNKVIVPPWDRLESFKNTARAGIKNRFEKFKMLPVFMAGIVDGVNPCAFGVLIFFVTYAALSLKRSNKEILFIGLNFTLGVFAVYFLMGLGLLKFVNEIKSYYAIAKVFYFLVGITAIFLSILSFVDFYSALRIRNNKPVKLLLKLPFGLFNNIFQIIEKFAKLKHFIVFSFVAGFLVSLLEFFCTGQIYFPTIIYIVSVPELRLKAIAMLFLYCFAFVVPLLIVFLLIFTGVRSEKIENFNKRYLGTVKLLNGIIFLCLGIFILFSIK